MDAMNLQELFDNNLLKISVLKHLNIQNKTIMKVLDLNDFKRQTFSRYLLFSKNEIEEIKINNSNLFDEIEEEYKKHRNIELVLQKINSIFSVNIQPDFVEEKKIKLPHKEKPIEEVNPVNEEPEDNGTSLSNVRDLLKNQSSGLSFMDELREERKKSK